MHCAAADAPAAAADADGDDDDFADCGTCRSSPRPSTALRHTLGPSLKMLMSKSDEPLASAAVMPQASASDKYRKNNDKRTKKNAVYSANVFSDSIGNESGSGRWRPESFSLSYTSEKRA